MDTSSLSGKPAHLNSFRIALSLLPQSIQTGITNLVIVKFDSVVKEPPIHLCKKIRARFRSPQGIPLDKIEQAYCFALSEICKIDFTPNTFRFEFDVILEKKLTELGQDPARTSFVGNDSVFRAIGGKIHRKIGHT
jgi:hypothetical protein